MPSKSNRKSPDEATRGDAPGPVESLLLDALRTQGGSLQSVAEAAEVPKSSLTRFLNRDRTLKLPTVERLLRHFGARIVLPKKKSPTQARKRTVRG